LFPNKLILVEDTGIEYQKWALDWIWLTLDPAYSRFSWIWIASAL